MSVVVAETKNTVEVSDGSNKAEIIISEVSLLISDVGVQGAAGVGVPSGGTTGQILAKNSGTNYDTVWVNNLGGVIVSATDPASALEGQILYNTTEMVMKIWISGAWVTVGAAPSELDALLSMDGSTIVSQSNDVILYN